MILRRGILRVVLAAALCGAGAAARADAVLLMEDPVNFLGRLTSTGHAALWLDRLCSDDHTEMRMCRAGEPGAVVSRYQELKSGEWLAMPPGAYLYAVDREEEIPAAVTEAEVEGLRASYRGVHGRSFAVSPTEGTWVSLTGEAYRRRIVCVRVRTTEEQDRRLMAWLNERQTPERFNLLYANCADFLARMLNVLYPGAMHRSYLFDLGMMTPKQLEAGLHRYAMRHKELGWELRLLTQVPGDVPRSRRLYGVTESYLKHYWFLLPLDYLAPIELGPVTVMGICDHRYVGRPVARVAEGVFFEAGR